MLSNFCAWANWVVVLLIESLRRGKFSTDRESLFSSPEPPSHCLMQRIPLKAIKAMLSASMVIFLRL